MTRYTYETSADGLCTYSSKAAAIRAADKARALFVWTEAGTIVWRRALGGEEHGELRDIHNRPVRQPCDLD